MLLRKRLSVPESRPPPWPMKPLESAVTSFSRLPNGQLVLTIEHDVIRGVRPEMLVWWFEPLGESMEHLGRWYPRYLVWHPTDHSHWELARRAPEGGTGQNACFRIVEAFGGIPETTWIASNLWRSATQRVSPSCGGFSAWSSV